ncbi:hypothetical protein BDB01DRAFT_836525 [Pilobolus umbonatus]|nr:hypothetical protein BDB01DRAFT_836525 [Pilobolus umbonatus]
MTIETKIQKQSCDLHDINNWKIVGNPYTRDGLSRPMIDNNCADSGGKRPSSMLLGRQWGTFGGFKWEDKPRTNSEESPRSLFSYYHDINSSAYDDINGRQRSFSFSIGQNIQQFNHDNTTELVDTSEYDHDRHSLFHDIYIRSRSQSVDICNLSQAIWTDKEKMPNLTNSPSTLSSKFTPFDNYITVSNAENNEETQSLVDDINRSKSISPSPSSSINLLAGTLEDISVSSNYTKNNAPDNTRKSTKTSNTSTANTAGKGISIQKITADTPLYMVEFKADRTDFYYVTDSTLILHVGDFVIVEADRGIDLGKVITDILTPEQLMSLDKQRITKENDLYEEDGMANKKSAELYVKEIYRQACTEEIEQLIPKGDDEQRVLELCHQKIKDRNLPMEIVDAEYQWCSVNVSMPMKPIQA